MKKLCFMTVLMLALAAPVMASGGTYAGTGSIGDFCHIEGAPLAFAMGAPDFVGDVDTVGTGIVNANIDCTITCGVEAGGAPDRVLGAATGHSVACSIFWNALGLGGQSMAVPKPQINTPHDYTLRVHRGGHADLADAYSCTISLNAIP
jgi:hypothetical protein